MLERTFLGAPNEESLLHSFTVVIFVQHLPSLLVLWEALSALVETLCKNYLEGCHAKNDNLITSSCYRTFF